MSRRTMYWPQPISFCSDLASSRQVRAQSQDFVKWRSGEALKPPTVRDCRTCKRIAGDSDERDIMSQSRLA